MYYLDLLQGNITCLENYTLPQSTNISDSSLHSSSCPNTVLAYAYALDDALKTLCNETVCDEVCLTLSQVSAVLFLSRVVLDWVIPKPKEKICLSAIKDAKLCLCYKRDLRT